jgi:hypothetical protein
MGSRFEECRYCEDRDLSNTYGNCRYCRRGDARIDYKPMRFRDRRRDRVAEAFKRPYQLPKNSGRYPGKSSTQTMVPVMFDEFALRGMSSSCYKKLDIENVIFNPPATIVFWTDGTKTVVKADGEEFDAEKGLAMAISKKLFGNKYDYYETFKKWVGRYEKKNKRHEEGIYLSAEFDTKLMEDLIGKMPTKMSLVEVDAESLKELGMKKGK